MTTNENKPSPGAMAAAHEVCPLSDMKLIASAWQKDAARIIDSHTNAIADELAVEVRQYAGILVHICNAHPEAWSNATQGTGIATPNGLLNALARYNAIKSKGAK